jgi:hypothetical protein
MRWSSLRKGPKPIPSFVGSLSATTRATCGPIPYAGSPQLLAEICSSSLRSLARPRLRGRGSDRGLSKFDGLLG